MSTCHMALRALTDYGNTGCSNATDTSINFLKCMPPTYQYTDSSGQVQTNSGGLDCQPSCVDPDAPQCVLPGGIVDWDAGLIYQRSAKELKLRRFPITPFQLGQE
jgi:hypothetical protein